MKKLISLALATLLVLSCVAGVTFAADAEASWSDGTTTVEGTFADIAKQAANKGGTLKLLKDYTYTGEAGALFNSRISLTIDLNGNTLTTSNGAINITAGASGVTVVKNGTIISGGYNIAVRSGALQVQNVTMWSDKSQNINYFEGTDKFNRQNLIENCTIGTPAWVCFSFNDSKANQQNASMTIKNSTLIAAKTVGDAAIGLQKTPEGSTANIVLGEGVKIYNYNVDPIDSDVKRFTETLTKSEETQTVTILDKTFEDMVEWTTPATATKELEFPAPAAPAPLAPAETVASWTDGKIVMEGTLAEIAKQVSNKGGTVTLLKDVTVTGSDFAFDSKKSFTVDLNGKTLTTAKGAIRVSKGATGVTVVKNGTIISGTFNIDVRTGALQVQDVTMWSDKAQNINYYEGTDKFNHQNIIENCTIGNPAWVCFSFNDSKANQVKASMTVKNSTLIAAKSQGDFAFGLQKTPEGSTANVVLGEGVKIYTRSKDALQGELVQLGEAITKTAEGASATILDKTFEQMNEFTTPATATVELETVIPGPKPTETPAEPEKPAEPAKPATPAKPSTPAETEKKEEPKADKKDDVTSAGDGVTVSFEDENSAAPVGLIIGIVAAVAVIAVVAVVVLKKKKK